ncbi:MAG TPA: phosphoribosylglycinamide formyltransferase [Burkholderiaceae bacterium]|nr:phosphoribosylglycinamide formyltransferase [Burkholderiaceae bacterium]
MKNVVVLISGRGSNLRALLATARADDWEGTLGVRIAAVISNRGDAPGLHIAREFGVPTQIVPSNEFTGRDSFDAALARAIDAHRPHLVVLAGFMRVLTRAFVEHFAGRLINIHPSLLPAFPGLATHRQALAAGVRVHGATVHFVSIDVDAGPIIAQGVVSVRADDDEASLAARVLEVEHQLLPRCVALVAGGDVWLERDQVRARGDVAARLVVLEP